MGEHTSKMLIVGLLKETTRDIELSPAGTGRIDMRIVHDANLDLIQGARVVHGGDERAHDAADALSLLRIERMRRGLASARLCRLALAGRRAAYSGATRCQEEDEDGNSGVVRAHRRCPP
jgi:hypothetical protein